MKLSPIKKLFSLFSGRKKRGNGYLKSEIRLHSVPGKNGQYQQKNKRFTRLKQRLSFNQRNPSEGYNKPSKGKKWFARLGGAAFLTGLFLLLGMMGSGEKMLNGLKSLAYFRVTEINFTGCDIVPEERLRDAAGIVLHQTSLIGLNNSQIEKVLSSVPWIAKAEVKRNWPSTVEISVLESIPVALLQIKDSAGTQFHYIDRKGMTLLPATPGSDMDFPVITGLSEIVDPEVKGNAFQEALLLLKKIRGNDPHLPAESLSEIHVDRAGEMVVYMVEYPFPIFFGNGNTKRKYARLVQVLKVLFKKQKGKELISQVEYIQMDYLNDKVLVAQR
jgi:cell division septal protein FtsQ